jgi:hypothetical protein
MSATILSPSTEPRPVPAPRIASSVALALAAWLALIFVLGVRDAFVTPPGEPPLSIFLAVTLPIAAFLLAYRLSAEFRNWVLALDLRLATGIQAWRFAGLGFIALYTYGVLPGVFAWPAGLGDMAIGATAPWVILALIRRPDFARGRAFVAWNLLGILDLVVAVGIGTFVATFPESVAGATTGVMARLPLLLIPGYLVPLFLILHLTALLQARRAAASSAA